MYTIYSDSHRLHHGQAELIDGHFMPCFEKPERADLVLARVREVGLGDVLAPAAHGLDALSRVHHADYVEFLSTAWTQWTALGRTHDALPLIWPVPTLRQDARPRHIDGLLGYYALDASVPVMAGTWQAVRAAVDVALTGVDRLQAGDRAAFALCRPPGHHAAAAAMGGYCYLNNAAIAVQALRDQGVGRVAVLDVDYHHGNGTQSIFYTRGDVFVTSLHGDPAVEYPYFLGYADETGASAGERCNLNLPLPHGTAWPAYSVALDSACDAVARFGAGALVVSLGVDTFEQDPISRFRLQHDDYLRIGQRIARLAGPAVPVLFVFEGGYAVEAIGVNAVNVLQGFEQG